MKIGITGTRVGMTDYQAKEIYKVLDALNYKCRVQDIRPSFHHGDCVGVDVQVAMIASELGYHVVAHPGPGGDLQAKHKSDEIREHMSHFKRNRNIVDETDVLLVVPKENEWQSKGGTWYTASYAQKKNSPYVIFWPTEQEIE